MWVSTLRQFGLTVVIRKSASWVPGALARNDAWGALTYNTPCTSELVSDSSIILPDRALAGIPVLGTGVCREFESCLSLEDLPPLPTDFRLGHSPIPEPQMESVMLTPVLSAGCL